MNDQFQVRLTRVTIKNFKNVSYGDVKLMNWASVEKKAELDKSDIVGLYGQNGSGKTALIEALDIMKYVLTGNVIPYQVFEGLFSKDLSAEITNTFFISDPEQKYNMTYSVALTVDDINKRVIIQRESVSYKIFSKSWCKERAFSISNPYNGIDDILTNKKVEVSSKSQTFYKEISLFGALQQLAISCAQKNISLFFNPSSQKYFYDNRNSSNIEEKIMSSVFISLYTFAFSDMHVIRVSQLGAINSNTPAIPLNMRLSTESAVIMGCLPLFTNGQGEVPEAVYPILKRTIEAINIAIRSVIPNLQIEMEEKNVIEKEDGKYIVLDVFSRRLDKRFSIKYESEGIKRIISLLHYLISVYNFPTVCLIVDELDSGIFEYLLGELLGFLKREMKGQLIFTSHNLRAMEKLDTQNIICSTTNPENRYIRLTGISGNNNKRDFYIRSILLGGQKEELYNEDDLIAMGFAFRKAGKIEEAADIQFSDEFLNKLAQQESEDS